MKQETSVFSRVRQKLDLPPDLMPLDAQLVLSSNRELTVYGHRGIGGYDPEEIRVRIRGGFALVRGIGLEITRMNPARLVIAGRIAAVADRDAIIAITGSGKRELLGKPLSDVLAQVMEQRSIYQYQGSGRPLPVSDSSDRYTVAVAAPILCEGDVLGLVLFLSSDAQIPGEGEYKLAQTVSAFLGRHMET